MLGTPTTLETPDLPAEAVTGGAGRGSEGMSEQGKGNPGNLPRSAPESDPAPSDRPDVAQLLEELAQVEHDLAAVGKYREQLREKLQLGPGRERT